MATLRHALRHAARSDRGFTAIELLVATAITVVVLGGAVAITSQVQNGYRRQVEDAVAMQEGRFALEWIGRIIRGAGNDPFNVDDAVSCGAVEYIPVRWDPDGDEAYNSIRIQSDSNPPDGQIGGTGCDQAAEDVTISFDPDTNIIEFLDNSLGGEVATRTDNVIENLEFVYRNSDHAIAVAEADIVYVEVIVTVRTRTLDVAAGTPVTRTLRQDIRIRSLG